jgi:hypothetical protein
VEKAAVGGGRLCCCRHGVFRGEVEKHSKGWVTYSMVPPDS